MKRLFAFLASFIWVVALPSLAVNKMESNHVVLYSAPNSKTIIEKVSPNAALIPIYQEKQWVKVGDPRNGRIGWVNKNQARRAKEAFYRPDIQTIYIHEDRNSNGKPQLNIVAYKNGEKLSPQQAKRLYEKMRKQQMQEMSGMQRTFDQQWRQMRQMFQVFNMSPFFQPRMVLPATPNKKQKAEIES